MQFLKKGVPFELHFGVPVLSWLKVALETRTCPGQGDK